MYLINWSVDGSCWTLHDCAWLHHIGHFVDLCDSWKCPDFIDKFVLDWKSAIHMASLMITHCISLALYHPSTFWYRPIEHGGDSSGILPWITKVSDHNEKLHQCQVNARVSTLVGLWWFCFWRSLKRLAIDLIVTLKFKNNNASRFFSLDLSLILCSSEGYECGLMKMNFPSGICTPCGSHRLLFSKIHALLWQVLWLFCTVRIRELSMVSLQV